MRKEGEGVRRGVKKIKHKKSTGVYLQVIEHYTTTCTVRKWVHIIVLKQPKTHKNLNERSKQRMCSARIELRDDTSTRSGVFSNQPF